MRPSNPHTETAWLGRIYWVEGNSKFLFDIRHVKVTEHSSSKAPEIKIVYLIPTPVGNIASVMK